MSSGAVGPKNELIVGNLPSPRTGNDGMVDVDAPDSLEPPMWHDLGFGPEGPDSTHLLRSLHVGCGRLLAELEAQPDLIGGPSELRLRSWLTGATCGLLVLSLRLADFGAEADDC